MADDGEKFGGWPGTKEWVYGEEWLERFMATIGGLVEGGEVVLSRLDDALEAVPSGGLAYLPTASYREMESWSLPPDAALRLTRLERDLGEARVAGADGALIRGAALAQLPGQVLRIESDAQEDDGAERAGRAGMAIRPRRGAPSAGRNATTPTGTASSAASTCRISATRSGAIWRRRKRRCGADEGLA